MMMTLLLYAVGIDTHNQGGMLNLELGLIGAQGIWIELRMPPKAAL